MGKIFQKLVLAFKRIFGSIFGIFRKKEKDVNISPEIPIIREVPVEVIKEVIREVIKEVPVEVPIETIREIVKEVPVEVIREVTKEVKVEVPVEVIKEVIKEVPVEVIREVIREVPVMVEPKPEPEDRKPEEKQPDIGGPCPPPPNPPTPIKYDNSDIARLMSQWGKTYKPRNELDYDPYDFNKDGTIDGADLSVLLMKLSERMRDPNEFEVLCPHHEVMHDKWLNVADKNIFYPGSMEPTLKKMGVKKYFLFYPAMGQDQNDFRNKRIDVDIISQRLIDEAGADFEGYAMLDYEGDWFRSLDKGANTKENELITRVMVEALQELKKRFPKVKWSYYGIPKVPYWLPDPRTGRTELNWGNAPREVKESVMEMKLNAYRGLLLHCDYMNPSLYNRYDPEDDEVKIHIPNIENVEYEYRKAATLIARKVNEVNGTSIPILPMFSHTYAVGGDVEYPGKLVDKDFLNKTMFRPNLDVGVDGFMYWNAIHYYAWEALPTNDVAPSYNSGLAFCKNFGYEAEYSKIPWKKGSGPEELRTYWRDKYVECYNSAALKYLQIARSAFLNK